METVTVQRRHRLQVVALFKRILIKSLYGEVHLCIDSASEQLVVDNT